MDLNKLIERAEEATRRKNYDGAIALFHQLLDLHPGSAEGRRGLREALLKKWQRKQTGKASAVVSGVVPLVSASLGSLLRQHKTVARSLERYLVNDPLNLGKNMKLGQALEKADCKKGAAEVYEFIAQQVDGATEAWKAAGALRAELGQVQEALLDYEEALKISPRDQEALKARKNLAAEGALQGVGYDQGQHSRALVKNEAELKDLERGKRLHLTPEEIQSELSELEGRLADDPRNTQTLKRMGELHEKNGDPEAALDCLRLVVDYDPSEAAVKKQIAYLEVARFDQRIAALEARAGSDESAAEELAKLKEERDEFELQGLRSQVEATPTDMELRVRLGQKLQKAGKLDEAIAELQRSVGDPRFRTDSLVLLGQCFFRKKHYDLASGQLEKALESLSGMGTRVKDILYNLGVIAEKMEDPEKARSYYSRIFEADIGYRDVADKMERLNAR